MRRALAFMLAILQGCIQHPLAGKISSMMVASAYLTLFSFKLVSNTFFLRKRTHILRVIGQFVAKAMLDSRIIDLHFNKVFLKIVLGEEVPVTISTLKVRVRSTFPIH